MFKKLKDKLAEEVKSSPQRLQQFAQAAQAAVTSASSSVSDITNSELFSIGDNETQQNRQIKASSGDQKNSTPTFQDISLVQSGSLQTMDSMDFASTQDLTENPRQRRLSNSSFASDVSFRLPSYESPSMYHLQSDVEVSASEAEERGFSSGNVSLERVTKEQIYAAYRRTQDRYTKYRTQYADLARHYKLLERENAKAKSVLVETQDKALRRISELREQCSLEQSAKAHLEKALRIELEEKNLKIDTLDTKIKLLQSNNKEKDRAEKSALSPEADNSNIQFITFDSANNQPCNEEPPAESQTNIKIEKLEKLLVKYKDSLKTIKEKNTLLATELQILSGEVEIKNKEIEQLKATTQHLDEAKQKIEDLNDLNEELQNKISVYDFNKNKDLKTLELDLQKAQAELTQLQSKIDVFCKREEEYAISLAENKLSIHKELESKETEIKSLKDRLIESRQEIQSLDIVLIDYKNKSAKLEAECSNLHNNINELNSARAKVNELETQLLEVTQKCQALENLKLKATEEYNCLQLQLKQETAEKLAMVDRNTYLENRNTQLTEENLKKGSQISALDKALQVVKKDTANNKDNIEIKLEEKVDLWKRKCSTLESEILEEREELEKLQSEIEKILKNAELIQVQNSKLNIQVDELNTENKILREKQLNVDDIKLAYKKIVLQINELKKYISQITEETFALKGTSSRYVTKIKDKLDELMLQYIRLHKQTTDQNQVHKTEMEKLSDQLNLINAENLNLKSELKDYDEQKKEQDEKILKIIKEYESSINELNVTLNAKQKIEGQLKEAHDRCQALQKTIDHEKYEQNILKQTIADMVNKINNSENEDICVKKEKQNIMDQLKESEDKSEQLQNIVNLNNNEQLILKQNIFEMAERIKNFECSMKTMQSEKLTLAHELEETIVKCELLQDVVNRNNNDHTILKEKINNFQYTIETLQGEKQKLAKELDESNAKCEMMQDIINRNNNDQTILKEEILKFQQENSLLRDSKNQLKIDNTDLTKKLQHAQINQINIKSLQLRINDLTQENISLRKQSEITNSIKDLEVELKEVRKSHAEIEIEKDHLNSIIEQLDTKETMCYTQSTQTDNTDQCNYSEQRIKEVKSGKFIQTLSSDESTDVHQLLVQANNKLKEDNQRLQSDVAGLQTYLAKISKENSVLNDKLRELIASSENSQENSNVTMDLKNEVQVGNKKVDDLIRENNLLIEENLELKDQLNSQHHTKQDSNKSNQYHDNDREYLTLKEKYTSLLDINNRLEKRMLDLEQMNGSVNGNMSQIQQQNEKLRLTNDKLERRLDEALVSLRHLHALQENTELEYLRNILYEYLTGTGAHSVTLAKVLAAVVKFDKTQTDLVIQKEKERQGFLKQLGLL